MFSNRHQHLNPSHEDTLSPPPGFNNKYHNKYHRQAPAVTVSAVSSISSLCGFGLETELETATSNSNSTTTCCILYMTLANDHGTKTTNTNTNTNTTAAATQDCYATDCLHGRIARVPEEVLLCLRDPASHGCSNNESSSPSSSPSSLMHQQFVATKAVSTAPNGTRAPTTTNTTETATETAITNPQKRKRGREYSPKEEGSKVPNHTCLEQHSPTNANAKTAAAGGNARLLSPPLLLQKICKSSNPSSSLGGLRSRNWNHPLCSIPKAIRRNFRAMTRETRLVPRTPPPIVIGSSSSSNSNSKSNLSTNCNDSFENDGGMCHLQTPIRSLFSTPRGSNSKQQQEPATIPSLLFLRTHALLGKGGFATVTSVTVETTTTSTSGRRNNNCYGEDSSGDNSSDNNYYYACKSTKEELFAPVVAKTLVESENHGTDETTELELELERKHRRAYVQAESQLLYEAHVLGSLNHPNIIRLLGLFSSTTTNSRIDCNSNSGSFTPPSASTMFPPTLERSFLLTEILEETLTQKLARWRTADKTKSSLSGSTATTRASRNHHLEKLSICHQLAEALEHVHSHNIAYRDLKPDNIGFLGSSLKLFDFGLSREMILPIPIPSGNGSTCFDSTTSIGRQQQHQPTTGDDDFPVPVVVSKSPPSSLKGIIGTMRYMAPEVCLDRAYDCDCDLYSYSVLCWEVWTHEIPYANLTPSSYKEMVCLRGLRPPDVLQQQQQQHNYDPVVPRFEILPRAIAVLLEKGWVHDPKSRIRWPGIRQQLVRILHGGA